jgi:pyridinium-3,5-biscarboxylic acid mononucleotide sulfurtransferase
LVVGFDLDMTLFDTRPGVKRVWEALSASTDLRVDSDLVISRLGPPLSSEMANWVAAERVDEFVDRYRSLYADHAIEPTIVLPGAHSSLAAVQESGGRVLIVTAKHPAHARRHVDHAGLPIDVVVGDLWGSGKGEALSEHGASVYVGDHVLDVAGAHAAGAVAVGVATGPCTRAELADAGADVVLRDLTEFPQWFRGHVLEVRVAALTARLTELGSLLVAFSGGADSALVLAAATRVLGPDRVAAATAVSASLPAAERTQARQFAADLGVRYVEAETREIEREGYRANAGDRCYFCKAELVDVLTPIAHDLGLAAVATGTNADDAAAGFRPGIRAAAERDAATPLLDAGLTKAQVRELSRQWGLPTWNKPAAACLSSRIAYGVEVTPERLARVERAELAVRSLFDTRGTPLHQLRVRDLGGVARLELDHAALTEVGTDAALESQLLKAVLRSGFDDAVVDPAGFRSGSMNELLADPVRYR